jgi:hypothetical protein
MSHKKIAIIAVIMVVVFGTITIVYPLMFNPVEATSPAAVPAPALPATH